MFFRIIRNDIKSSKIITLTTTLFIAAAATLVALVAILVVNLSGAIDALMVRAKTPHFMQMHAGNVDAARLNAFVEGNPDIADFQVLPFLNIDGARFEFEGKSLAGSVQDNGLTTQSKQFDFLLDLDGQVIHVSEGEVYVPICYLQDGTAKVGETLTIAGKTFTIAGFLRDSQMNSLLSSSKRFLVSEHDFAALKTEGSIEHLIEFRLHDLSSLAGFETAYITAGLEANGPTLTYPLFKMINAITDGMMIAVILLLSALIIVIAFLCIRFTLLAKIEDDYREIGVMKAIGVRIAEIKKLYLAKYTAMAAIGSVLGFGVACLLRGLFLENIRLYMGESEQASLSLIIGSVGILIIFFTILAYVNGVLQHFRKISAAEAVRFGVTQEKPRAGKAFHLAKNRLLNTNVFLGIKDVLARKSLYLTMLIVFAVAAFISIIPQNLHHTISSKSFVTYMGIGNSDLLIGIQRSDGFDTKTLAITKALTQDDAVSTFTMLTTKVFTLITDEGVEQKIKVELGDHAIFPVTYTEGSAPANDNEIALSVLNANELSKKVGEKITLMINGHKTPLTLCGIYSDITNGGKTAKATFVDDTAAVMWRAIHVALKDGTLAEEKAAEYSQRFEFAKVASVNQYFAQTFGSTLLAIEKASVTAIVVALVIITLITLLFMRMLIIKDRASIAIMKAFGFANRDIKAQYMARSVVVLVAGIILGTVLANTLGEALAGAAIASFGAASFRFSINPVFAFVLCPLMMAGTALAATAIGTMHAGQIHISNNCIISIIWGSRKRPTQIE